MSSPDYEAAQREQALKMQAQGGAGQYNSNLTLKPIDLLQARLDELAITHRALQLLHIWLAQNLVSNDIKEYIISRVLSYPSRY